MAKVKVRIKAKNPSHKLRSHIHAHNQKLDGSMLWFQRGFRAGVELGIGNRS